MQSAKLGVIRSVGSTAFISQAFNSVNITVSTVSSLRFSLFALFAMEYSKAITSSDAQLWVDRIPALDSNYIWAINHVDHAHCVIIDPGAAAPVINYLERAERLLGAILITHRHADHIAGLSELRKAYPGVPVYGPDHELIGADIIVSEHGGNIGVKTSVSLFDNALVLDVLHVPGHLKEHVAYSSTAATAPWVFSGDIVFSAGCGRNFEGHPSELHQSILRLSELSDNTVLFCVHEYTEANLAFARKIDPNNKAIRYYSTRVSLLRSQGGPTSPTTVRLEKLINPFFRCDRAEIKSGVARMARLSVESDAECFATMRKLKDSFIA